MSGYSVRGVAELPGGELAGQMAPACLAVWDASMWGCMCACLLYRLEAWLVAAALTDSMPMLRRLYNLSEYSRQAQREGGECEIERGRERERERESHNLLCRLLAGWLTRCRLAGRLVVCLAGWLFVQLAGPRAAGRALGLARPRAGCLAGRPAANHGCMVARQAGCLSAFTPRRPLPLLRSPPACMPPCLTMPSGSFPRDREGERERE